MLDLERLYRGLDQVVVMGVCNSEVRHKALEDAIAAIQTNLLYQAGLDFDALSAERQADVVEAVQAAARKLKDKC